MRQDDGKGGLGPNCGFLIDYHLDAPTSLDLLLRYVSSDSTTMFAGNERGRVQAVVSVIFTFLAAIVILLRLVVRIAVLRNYSIDDGLITIAFVRIHHLLVVWAVLTNADLVFLGSLDRSEYKGSRAWPRTERQSAID